MKPSLFFLLFLTIALTTSPLQAHAFSFNPNHVLTDGELKDPFAMDLSQISQFLSRGGLKQVRTEDADGVVRTAAEIIYNTSIKTGLNPKFLLVLLQKEQSLVEDPAPTQRQLDWATGYAVCDDCSKEDPTIQRWKGFGKQVNSAALQFSEGYLADIETKGSTQGKYGPGLAVEVDDTIIVPANAATASLYAYTPHLHGNENFAKIWNRWFSVVHPSGTLLQVAGEPGIYLIEHGYKRPIRSWSAFLSRFNKDLVIEVPASTLVNYPTGTPIDFPNYSLLKDETGAIYLLVDDTIRHIDSMETFRTIGYSTDEIVDVTSSELASFTHGNPLTTSSTNPRGNLLKLGNDVFYIQDGKRHAVVDPLILAARFPNQVPTPSTAEEISQYPEGVPLTFPDGYLVKSADDATVYVISDGEKRAISSESVFRSYGWSFTAVRTVDKFALKLHPNGLPISDSADVLTASE